MCKCPSRIRNVAYDPADPLSAEFVDIPCGHCDECRDTRISEVLFRADWQTQLLGDKGFMVFVTLTFNNEHLPIVTWSTLDGEVKTCSTWNNKRVRNWVNSLQKYCARKHWICKYLITCERGGNQFYTDENGQRRQATSRPHYHAILWVYPNSEVSDVSALNYMDVFKKATTLWSDSPRNFQNVACDISTKVPQSRFVASIDPVGYVYNERVARTDNQAVKYVVKYCVKDSTDPSLCVPPAQIISHSDKIPFSAMQPRVRYSNGIGLNFLDFLDVSEDTDPALASERLCNYIGIQSDGNKTRIPRYYIKRLSQKVVTIFEEQFPDEVLTFDGENVVPKYAQHTPFTWNDHEPTFNWRIKKTTTTIRTAIGEAFTLLNARKRVQDLVEYLPNFLSSSLPDFKSAPFFSNWGHYLQSLANSVSNNFVHLVGLCRDYFATLTLDDFLHLDEQDRHFPWSSSIKYHDELVTISPEEDGEHITWFLVQLWHQLKQAYSVLTHFTQSSTKYQNMVNYKQHLTQAVIDNPNLFVHRDI